MTEGVLCAKKDFMKPKHHDIDVPNLEVIKLMQSLESKKFVRTTFSWCVLGLLVPSVGLLASRDACVPSLRRQWYYWYLTPEGIDYLRKYLNLPAEVIPETLKKAAVTRASGFGRGVLLCCYFNFVINVAHIFDL